MPTLVETFDLSEDIGLLAILKDVAIGAEDFDLHALMKEKFGERVDGHEVLIKEISEAIQKVVGQSGLFDDPNYVPSQEEVGVVLGVAGRLLQDGDDPGLDSRRSAANFVGEDFADNYPQTAAGLAILEDKLDEASAVPVVFYDTKTGDVHRGDYTVEPTEPVGVPPLGQP